MDVLIVLLATTSGTLLMTLFSHLLSINSELIYNEAHLLNLLFDNAKEETMRRRNLNHLHGWLVHFAIGLGMAIGLYFIHLTPGLMNTVLKAVLWGIIAGTVGVLGWLLLFNVYGIPKKASLKPFFIQLVVAHTIFTLTCFIIFKISH